MLGSAGWTGAVRWLVAALFVAVLSLSPTIDALICGDDLSVGSAAAAESIALGDQAITFPQDDHGTAATDVCVHGHCHHFAPFGDGGRDLDGRDRAGGERALIADISARLEI